MVGSYHKIGTKPEGNQYIIKIVVSALSFLRRVPTHKARLNSQGIFYLLKSLIGDNYHGMAWLRFEPVHSVLQDSLPLRYQGRHFLLLLLLLL